MPISCSGHSPLGAAIAQHKPAIRSNFLRGSNEGLCHSHQSPWFGGRSSILRLTRSIGAFEPWLSAWEANVPAKAILHPASRYWDSYGSESDILIYKYL